MDSGMLEIKNTNIYSQFGFGVYISGQAQVYFFNSRIEENGWISCFEDSNIKVLNSTLTEIRNTDRSKVVISDSEIVWTLGLEFLLSSQIVCLEGLRPGLIGYWNLHENQSAFNVLHDLTVENTFVNSWSVGVDPESNVTTLNSEIERMRYGFTDMDITIDGARLGFYRNYTLGKTTFVNTSVIGHWQFWFHSCFARISNSTAVISPSSYSNLSITESIITLDPWGWINGTAEFQDTKIDCIKTAFSSYYVYGEIEFSTPADVRDWISTNITRNYDIIVTNGTGNPVPYTELSLYDENRTAVWNGATDSHGKANFNSTFSDSNYTVTLSLAAVKGNCFAGMNVTLLADTPLVLTLRYFADLNSDGNSDGKVDILDIAMAARACGTKPEDPGWEDTADINNDGVINILDISAIAKEYGKTV